MFRHIGLVLFFAVLAVRSNVNTSGKMDWATVQGIADGSIKFEVPEHLKITYDEKDYIPKWNGSNRYLDLKTGQNFDNVNEAQNTYFDRASNATYYVNEMHPNANWMCINEASPYCGNRHKRQSPNLVLTYCTDINMGGTCGHLYDNQTGGLATLPAPFDLGISSIQVNGYYLYYVSVFTGQNFGGASWVFRSLFQVDNLIPYGILNDQIRSISFSSMPFNNFAVFYTDNTYQGISVVAGMPVVPSLLEYPTMGDLPYVGNNLFPNDAMSSMFVFHNTCAHLFQNIYFGGLAMVQTCAVSQSCGAIGVPIMPTGWNDFVSSAVITDCP